MLKSFPLSFPLPLPSGWIISLWDVFDGADVIGTSLINGYGCNINYIFIIVLNNIIGNIFSGIFVVTIQWLVCFLIFRNFHANFNRFIGTRITNCIVELLIIFTTPFINVIGNWILYYTLGRVIRLQYLSVILQLDISTKLWVG